MRYSQTTAIVVAAASLSAPSVQAQEVLSEEGFGFFYDSLAPYGDWIQVAGYGPCWRPEMDEDWAPYTEGYWAYTDVGWTWVSHEPFGSIVYHYGRWLLSDRGWCWVPGADWSPAWVSWRSGPDYIGWAPLPPEVPWHPQRGISNWVDVHTEIGPAYYRFCSVRDFSSPVLSGVLLRPSRNAVIMVRTENVTHITIRNSSVFCGGPRYDWVSEHASGRVPLLRVAREENVSRFRSLQASGGGVQNIVHNNILVLPAPRRVECNAVGANFAAPSVSVSFSKGWYSNRSENERLKSHINREWEERRTTPPPSSTVKDFTGSTVRLTAPTAAEKAAVLGEIAGVPGAGTGRPGTVTRGPVSREGGPLDVPKARPVQALPEPLAQPPLGKPVNVAGGEPLPSAGVEKQRFGRPSNQSETHKNGEGSFGTAGGRPSQFGNPGSVPVQRSTPAQQPERNPVSASPVNPTAITGQQGRSYPSGANLEPPSRFQSGQEPPKNVGIDPGPRGVSPSVRSGPESVSGFSQPQVSRSGSGFSQQPSQLAQPQAPQRQPFGGTGLSSRPEGAQASSPPGALRGVGGGAPLQASPLPRGGQPPAVVDQPARFQGAGGSQAPRVAQPSSAGGSVGGPGISAGGRPSAPPSGASSAPPSAPVPSPASPGASGQKKKPGDPGYVPGTP
jgi:hypothetical protein